MIGRLNHVGIAVPSIEDAKATYRDLYGVPASAIIDSGSKQIVLVAKGEGRFEPRSVKLGRRGDGFVEIVEGLKAGDEVVTAGQLKLRDGVPVKAVPATTSTISPLIVRPSIFFNISLIEPRMNSS